MSDTKTAAQTAAKNLKMPEAFQGMADAGKKAFMAYVEAGTELNAQLDRVTRAQVGHLAQANKETAELIGASIETGIKVRETARKATIELIEGAFAAAK